MHLIRGNMVLLDLQKVFDTVDYIIFVSPAKHSDT